MDSAIQAKQVRPTNLIAGCPLEALDLIQIDESGGDIANRTQGPGVFVARIGGLDPRLIITASANLQVQGGGAMDLATWPGESLISLSVYPVVSSMGENFYGDPDPNCDDKPVYPKLRADGSIVRAFGFSIQPTEEEYDLVLKFGTWPTDPYWYFDRVAVHFSAYAGIHPAAIVPDALALINRVSLSKTSPTLKRYTTVG